MKDKLVYQIADDIVKALFTNGAGKEARRLVLEMSDGRNGGGWAMRAARDHIVGVIEKHLAGIESTQHSVERTSGTDEAIPGVVDEIEELWAGE